MKKNARAVLCALLALFTALSGYFFYAVYANGNRWFTTPYNTRLRAARGSVIAGDILDRNGTALVTSSADGSREYPTDRDTRKALSHVLGDVEGTCRRARRPSLRRTCWGSTRSLADRATQIFAEKRRGSDVQLTIDADLQTYIAEQFPEDYNGAVALLNYKTGEVLALYSKPEYDAKHPEDDEDAEDQTGVLLNRATQGRYAPGSVFKIVTLACALENLPGVQDRVFTCEETYAVTEEMDLIDTDGEGHGTLTLEEAFTKSCNIVFGQLALELGEEKLRATAERMGFNGNFLFEDLIVYESIFPKAIEDEGELAWTGVGQGNLDGRAHAPGDDRRGRGQRRHDGRAAARPLRARRGRRRAQPPEHAHRPAVHERLHRRDHRIVHDRDGGERHRHPRRRGRPHHRGQDRHRAGQLLRRQVQPPLLVRGLLRGGGDALRHRRGRGKRRLRRLSLRRGWPAGSWSARSRPCSPRAAEGAAQFAFESAGGMEYNRIGNQSQCDRRNGPCRYPRSNP